MPLWKHIWAEMNGFWTFCFERRVFPFCICHYTYINFYFIYYIFRWGNHTFTGHNSPRAIKKVDRHPPKSWPQCCQFWTLDDCNVSCWADGTSPIMDFDLWALGLSSPMKNKKNFFDSCGKKTPFFKILHVKKIFHKRTRSQVNVGTYLF